MTERPSTAATLERRPAAPAGEPLLDALQERMERIIRGDAPNAGRFCAYCYGRVEADDQPCSTCGRAAGSVPAVPRDALRVYNVYRKKMQLWVNLWAFTGILLAMILAGMMIAFLPNPWNFTAVAMLFFGSWYLANLLGGGLGAYLGARQGGVLRAAAWDELLRRRAAGENLDAR